MLRFTPHAWAKLHYLCHRGETEIGGFGLSSEADLMLIEDVLLLEQTTTVASVSFDDEAVADLFDCQVDQGIAPQRFARIWLHTHPGDSAQPSGTDEETFERVFGFCDWAVMFILAKGGQTYARLRFNVGPGGETHLPVAIDYRQPFEGSDHSAWEAAYQQCIQPVALMGSASDPLLLDGFEGMTELMEMDQMEQLDGFDRWAEPVGDMDDVDKLINHTSKETDEDDEQ